MLEFGKHMEKTWYCPFFRVGEYTNIPKNKLKLVLNTKIKKTTVYFIPKISRARTKEYEV